MPRLRLFSRLSGTAPALALVLASARAAVTPAPLPELRTTDFHFPESEATLTRWITDLSSSDDSIAARAFEHVHRHAWGLWTAITAETTQRYDGQRLRVFETWLGLDELRETTSSQPPTAVSLAAAPAPARTLRLLKIRDAEHEIEHGESDPMVNRVIGFVKFDPTAAEHIARQRLLARDTLDTLLDAGAIQVPPFPVTAVAVKPVFQIVRTKDRVQGRYYALKAWPGPPATPRPWAPASWPGAVWVDLAGGGGGQGAVDALALPDGSTRTEDVTYPVSSFLHYRLSATDASALNAGGTDAPATAGDIALLVAMHVSGREIARWTWQTFWWVPAADAPVAPSSAAIAALRPPELTGAARHYAMALAYTMLSPDQPYTGGRNAAPAVYAFNPWLEARLGPADLPDSIPGFAPDGTATANNLGIQTNCMSCHAQANYNPRQRATAPRLAGARYVDLGAAEFVGTLQVDFMWSLARHAR